MFITFEGPEGGGKTTQIRLLATALAEEGHAVCLTREPGGTAIGNAIRQVLLDMNNTAMSDRSEALLFNAARAQLIDEVIQPALARGEIVLCDRYADSTLAYQGYGRQLDLDGLANLIAFATNGLRPDITFYLHIDPAAGIERKRQLAHHLADEEWNRLEEEALAFHQRVEAGFQELIVAEPTRWITVDATASIDAVHQAVWAATMARMA